MCVILFCLLVYTFIHLLLYCSRALLCIIIGPEGHHLSGIYDNLKCVFSCWFSEFMTDKKWWKEIRCIICLMLLNMTGFETMRIELQRSKKFYEILHLMCLCFMTLHLAFTILCGDTMKNILISRQIRRRMENTFHVSHSWRSWTLEIYVCGRKRSRELWFLGAMMKWVRKKRSCSLAW